MKPHPCLATNSKPCEFVGLLAEERCYLLEYFGFGLEGVVETRSVDKNNLFSFERKGVGAYGSCT